MAIYEGSRYETSPIFSVRYSPDHDGRMLAIYPVEVYPNAFRFRTYVAQEGDRLDQLAYKFYQDSEMWWILAVANPELFYPGEIPAGTVLRIPNG